MKKGKERTGFTLSEVLIVVAIIGILLAVAAPNVISYYRSLKLTELDDSARTIFMAAQNRLTAMKSAGEDLSSLGGPLKGVPVSGGTAQVSAVTEKEELASLVPGGSIESQLHDNHYVVEIDPKTGAVFAVWYWEKESFNYELDAYSSVLPEKSKRLDAGKMVGYYGGDKIDRLAFKQMPFPEVKLINAEELRVEIGGPTIKFDATVEGFSEHDVLVDVIVNGVEIVKNANLCPTGADKITGTVVLDTLKADTYTNNYYEGAGPGSEGNGPGNGAENWTYGMQYKAWVDKMSAVGKNLPLPGEELTIAIKLHYNGMVKIDGEETGLMPQTVTVKCNSLFESVDGNTAKIAYGRHLQNLDTDTSGVNETVATGGTPTITAAEQVQDINFNDSVNVTGIQSWKDTYGYDTLKFSPINTSTLTKYDGGTFEIRYLNVGKLSSTLSANLGLFGLLPNEITLEDIILVNTMVEAGDNVGALVGYMSSGSLENCHVYLDEFDPAGSCLADKGPRLQGQNAGGLVGMATPDYSPNDFKLENCSASTIIEATNQAGGLVGNVMGDFTINSSYAACNITGAHIGGLVGMSNGVEIHNSYAAGTADVIGGVDIKVSGLFNGSATEVKNSYAAVRYGNNVISKKVPVNGTFSGDTKNYYVKQNGVDYASNSGVVKTTSELAAMIGVDPFDDSTNWSVPDGGAKVNPMGQTYPYNTLGTDLADPYPYPMLKGTTSTGEVVMPHYGDWVEDNVAAMPIYWESYWDNDADADNGEYGFYGPDGEINSLKAEKPGTENAIVKADGIAVFVPLGMDAPEEFTVYGQQRRGYAGTRYHEAMGPTIDVPEEPSLYVAVNASGKTTLFNYDKVTDTATPRDPGGFIGSGDARYACYILDLSPLKLEEDAERDKKISGFYMEFRDEDTDISLWCNPFFPCEVLAAEPEDPTMPLEKKNVPYYDKNGALQSYTGTDVLLRSPRHLNDLAAYTRGVDYYVKQLGTSATVGDFGVALRYYHYLQTADIDYAKYDAGRFTTVRTGQSDATRQIGIWLNGKYDPDFTWNIGDSGYTANRYLIKNAFLREGLFYVGGGTIDGLRLVNTSVKCVEPWSTTTNSCTGGTVARQGENVRFVDCGAYSETAELYEERCVEMESYNAYGGGFVGNANWSGWYEDCFAAVKVTVRAVSDGCAGGFVGEADPSNSDAVTFKNCYAGGHTVNGMYDPKDPNVTLTVLEDDTINWDYGEVCVAGFAGMIGNMDQFTLLGTNYSTCSVGLYHAEKVKQRAVIGTFLTVGYCPQANYPSTDSDTVCYSTAAAYDENGDLLTKETFTSRNTKFRWVDREYRSEYNEQEKYHLVDFTACAATQAADFDTRPYDDVLEDMTYPYKTNLSAHYGDWPLLKPMLVYYEKYNDDTYGYYSVTCKGETFTDTLNTLHVGTPGDGVTVVEDGYRLLAPFDMNLGTSSSYAVTKDEDFPVVVNGCVAYEIERLTKYDDSGNLNKYYRTDDTTGPIGVNFTYGGKKYVFWCNPCFACEAFDMTEAKTDISTTKVTKVNLRYTDKTGKETTKDFTNKIIRSPRHLGMATIDSLNANGRKWEQLLDIDYAAYTAPLTYGEAKKGVKTTVGQTKDTPQRPLCLGYLIYLGAASYNGNHYLIKNLYVAPCEEKAEDTSNMRDIRVSAGVFSVQNGCVVDGVRLVNVNVTGTKNVGGLAGVCEGGGKITDCGIYVDKAENYDTFTVTGTENVGGLVGKLGSDSAQMTNVVEDSFAAVKVTGNDYVGGLVGWAGYSAKITDCYAGGHTVKGEYEGESANITGNDYVGGLLGRVGIIEKNRLNYGAKIISSYSTASVKATAASPVHLGALIGDGPTYEGYDYNNTTISSLYARNRVFDKDGNATNGRAEPYLESVKDVLRTADYQKAAYPYDNTLGDKFPYRTNLTEHHGDWLEPPTGQLVYWEGYAKGAGEFSYNFYGGENSDINCLLGTEKGSVSRDGYGILVPAGKEVPEVYVYDYSSDPLKLELLSENENFRGKNYDLYGFKLPMHMRDKLILITNNYYHEIYVGAEKLWFNPDFACEVFATEPADLTKPAPKTFTEYGITIPLTDYGSGYVIRSARQLVNMGRYPIPKDKIFQWLDIDFAAYDAGTLYDAEVDGKSPDLRYSHPMRLPDGNTYTCWGFDVAGSNITNNKEEVREIRNLYIGDQSVKSTVNAMGLFDQVGGNGPDLAILKNLHLVNVDVVGNGTGDLSVGGLAGRVSGAAKIENCGIYVSSAENYKLFTIRGDSNAPNSQDVGGLFGNINWVSTKSARPVVENCFAAVKVVSVRQSGTAGGFAGNASYCTIKNCYSGGHTVNGKYVDTANTDANVVAKGLRSNGAGGLVGTSRDATFEGVCYSTCSVYCYPSSEDRMGAFIGYAYEDPIVAVGATVYATGKAVGTTSSLRTESYLSPALTTAPTSGKADATATKYDQTLGNTYPYQAAAGQTVHHGDWYVPDISAAFYWEKEQVYSWNAAQSKWVAEGDPEYHYHLMGVSDQSPDKSFEVKALCTDHHDDGKIHQIDHYGYGVLTTGDGIQTKEWGGESCGMQSPVTSSFTTDEIAVKALIEKELGASTSYFGVYHCDGILSHEYNQYKYVLSITGAARTIYFTIDFADLYLDEKHDGPETFTIRSARQLDNIIDSKNRSSSTTYLQAHDVGAVGYNGYTAPDIQSLTYKGQFYRILELSIKSSDDVALFKIARGTNTLENMVLYSPSGKARIEATNDQKAAGGLIAYLDIGAGYNTTIENCAVAGYTFCTPRNTEGGLVGYANHDLTIRNCEAVNTFHRRDNDNISTKDNPLGIGGLVGPVGNDHDAFPRLTIENSYAGGVITGNSTAGSVGGLYGGGRAPTTLSISGAYSYMDLSSCWMDTSNLTWTDRETVNTRKEVNTIGHGASGTNLYYYNGSGYLPQYDTTQSNHQWNYQGEGNGQGKATSDLGNLGIGQQPTKSYVPGSTGLKDLGPQTSLKAVVKDADGSYVHYGVWPTAPTGDPGNPDGPSFEGAMAPAGMEIIVPAADEGAATDEVPPPAEPEVTAPAASDSAPTEDPGMFAQAPQAGPEPVLPGPAPEMSAEPTASAPGAPAPEPTEPKEPPEPEPAPEAPAPDPTEPPAGSPEPATEPPKPEEFDGAESVPEEAALPPEPPKTDPSEEPPEPTESLP